jgi:hypothetical protein
MTIDMSRLTTQQKCELAFRLRDLAVQDPHPLHPVSRTGKLPLSFGQQRLWFLSELAPADPSYNIAGGVYLQGKLNVRALKGAIDEIVRRHEALRTRFVSEDGIPEQIIEEEVRVLFAIVDLSNVTLMDGRHILEREMRIEAHQPFELSRAPLLRVALLRIGPQEHVLLLTMHHIVSDGWSMGLLVRELGAVYEAFVRDLPSPLRPLRLQYADYAVWSRERLQGQLLEAHMNYWKQQLSGGSSPVFSTEPARHEDPDKSGATQSVRIPKELTGALTRMGQSEAVTLFVVLLSALIIMLVRYSGERVISIGSPIANRTRPELESIVGFFANTIVLRIDAFGNPSVRELLRRVGEVCLQAYEHQELPFERLVHELHPERLPGATPLFQVSFALQNSPAVECSMSGLRVQTLPRRSRTAHFDLEWEITPQQSELQVDVTYRTRVLTEGLVTRMLGHYDRLLQAIVGDPNGRIQYLPMLTEAEHRERRRQKPTMQ